MTRAEVLHKIKCNRLRSVERMAWYLGDKNGKAEETCECVKNAFRRVFWKLGGTEQVEGEQRGYKWVNDETIERNQNLMHTFAK